MFGRSVVADNVESHAVNDVVNVAEPTAQCGLLSRMGQTLVGGGSAEAKWLMKWAGRVDRIRVIYENHKDSALA